MSDRIIEMDIKGVEALTKKMDQMVIDLSGDEMLEGIREATMLVTRDARILAPVDTGRLRASIAPEVDSQGKEVRGVVGSNVVYAPFQEDKVHYLENAFTANLERIRTLIGDVVGRITKK
jgi:hypothetical protein